MRGEARHIVEFIDKTSISVTSQDFALFDRLSWDSHNKGEDLQSQVLAFCRYHMHYRKIVYADQVCQPRSNCAFCKRHNINFNVPRLDKPKNDPELVVAEKKIAVEDQRKRNGVYGKIGQPNRRFDLTLFARSLPIPQLAPLQ